MKIFPIKVQHNKKKTVISVRGGLSLREGICILEEIYDTGRLAAVDLVEVNPAIGSEDDVAKTVDAAIQILKAACGTVRKGVMPNDTEIPKPCKDNWVDEGQ